MAVVQGYGFGPRRTEPAARVTDPLAEEVCREGL